MIGVWLLVLFLLVMLSVSNSVEHITYQPEFDETLPPKGDSGRRYVSGFT